MKIRLSDKHFVTSDTRQYIIAEENTRKENEDEIYYRNLRFSTSLKHIMKVYKEDFKIKASEAKSFEKWVSEIEELSGKMDKFIDRLNENIANENLELKSEISKLENKIVKLEKGE